MLQTRRGTPDGSRDARHDEKATERAKMWTSTERRGFKRTACHSAARRPGQFFEQTPAESRLASSGCPWLSFVPTNDETDSRDLHRYSWCGISQSMHAKGSQAREARDHTGRYLCDKAEKCTPIVAEVPHVHRIHSTARMMESAEGREDHGAKAGKSFDAADGCRW